MLAQSFAIIENENKYLLISEASGKWRGKWYFPGGDLKAGEDPVSAAIRETKEEANCKIVLDGFFYLKLEKRLFTTKFQAFYFGRPTEQLVKTNKDEHSLGSKWFSYEEITRLPLREDALKILDLYRARNSSLPIYHLHFVRNISPLEIRLEDFNPF